MQIATCGGKTAAWVSVASYNSSFLPCLLWNETEAKPASCTFHNLDNSFFAPGLLAICIQHPRWNFFFCFKPHFTDFCSQMNSDHELQRAESTAASIYQEELQREILTLKEASWPAHYKIKTLQASSL